MDSVLQLLLSQLSGDALGKISEQVGVDEEQARKAVGVALPMLIGALNRNTDTSDGARALGSALRRDHDGGILENLPQAVTRRETIEDGSAILGHVLGGRESALVKQISRATNLDPNHVSQIIAILAPILLGALGKMQRSKDLDDQGLSNLLAQERKTVEQTSSGLTQLFDMDGNGDVSEEIVSLGVNLLGGLFGKGS